MGAIKNPIGPTFLIYRVAATHLRCGGIVNDRCIANFLEIVTVKEFLKSANI